MSCVALFAEVSIGMRAHNIGIGKADAHTAKESDGTIINYSKNNINCFVRIVCGNDCTIYDLKKNLKKKNKEIKVVDFPCRKISEKKSCGSQSRSIYTRARDMHSVRSYVMHTNEGNFRKC